MATRTTHRKSYPAPESEFGGTARPNTILARDSNKELTNVEKLRLIYLTGTTDVDENPNRRAWLGFKNEESVIDFED